MIVAGSDRVYIRLSSLQFPSPETRAKPRRKRADFESKPGYSYGVPDGAPAICQENARNEEAVKSIAGSTVE